jgi:hypothetical protein
MGEVGENNSLELGYFTGSLCLMSTTIVIPSFTPEDESILQLVREERKDWVRTCIESAITHLTHAHRLANVDPAMAMFRAITAEEEAASGLLRALQRRKYPGSKDLRPRSHLHKAAVYPFLMSIAQHTSYLKMERVDAIRLAITKTETKPRLVLALVLNGPLKGQIAQPMPPLNLRFREGSDTRLPDYRKYFLMLVGPAGFEDVLKYLEMKANERNLLLYASPQSPPNFASVPPNFLPMCKSRVMAIVKATLLVWPYAEVQQFAAEAIPAFLDLIKQVEKVSPNEA